jgi:hypothetical protein
VNTPTLYSTRTILHIDRRRRNRHRRVSSAPRNGHPRTRQDPIRASIEMTDRRHTMYGASLCRASHETRTSRLDTPVSAAVRGASTRRTFPDFRASRLDAPTSAAVCEASARRIDRKLEASQFVAQGSVTTTVCETSFRTLSQFHAPRFDAQEPTAVCDASTRRTLPFFRASRFDAQVPASVRDASTQRASPEFRASRLGAPTLRRTRRELVFGHCLHETEL